MSDKPTGNFTGDTPAGAVGSTAVAVRITGRVQGVWFRGWVRDEALRLGLTGSVRNQPDGSVAALFAGPGTAVAAMLALCHEGPPLARVLGVETTPVTPVPELAEFQIQG